MQLSRFLQLATLRAMTVCLATPLSAAAAPVTKLCATFSELAIHVEENRTDGDGEIVLVAKTNGEGLERLRILGPNRKEYEFEASRGGVGMSQFRFESAEPADIRELFLSFPAGDYVVRGKTVQGECIRGAVTLSHVANLAPTIVSPAAEAVVPTDAFVVTWSPVTGVSGYFVELTNEETLQVLRLDVDPSETSFDVPSSWLQPGTSYEVTVAAVSAATGNVASNQVVVTTEP